MNAALRHRTDIDGLRAVAILPIVLFHAGVSALAGGFVGVDIFFVISGFLITSIIARELGEGRFRLVEFYRRRAVRIFPALIVMCAIVLAYLGVEGVIDFKAVHKHVNHAISVVDAAEEDAADGDVDAVDDLEQGIGGFIDHEFWPDEDDDEEADTTPQAHDNFMGYAVVSPVSRSVGFHA